MDLLRFSTAGNVDDGKSTLIGRLLYDTKSILDDQLSATLSASERQGHSSVNLALFTDGLRTERERGITIDVAYRYFSTARRKFIIADTPGHFEFTRNMVTGASRSDVSLVLIDVSRGITPQTKRHALISEYLGIPRIIFCMNKMDLADYEESRFQDLVEQIQKDLIPHLKSHLSFIPISALTGDNVVERTKKMNWYQGASLLGELESVPTGIDLNSKPARFRVQIAIQDTDTSTVRYAGQLDSGTLTAGMDIVVQPEGRKNRVLRIHSVRGDAEEARAGEALQLTLESPVKRGDLLCEENTPVFTSSRIRARICWFSESAARIGSEWIALFSTKEVTAKLTTIEHEIDIESLSENAGRETLNTNALAIVAFDLSFPVAFDPYSSIHATGSFILVDPKDQSTVAAGMIL